MVWRVMVEQWARIAGVVWTLILFVIIFPLNSVAQAAAQDAREALPEAPTGTWNAPDESARGTAPYRAGLLKRFAGDQQAIWTSPLRLRRGDTAWALPALAGTGVF